MVTTVVSSYAVAVPYDHVDLILASDAATLSIADIALALSWDSGVGKAVESNADAGPSFAVMTALRVSISECCHDTVLVTTVVKAGPECSCCNASAVLIEDCTLVLMVSLCS